MENDIIKFNLKYVGDCKFGKIPQCKLQFSTFRSPAGVLFLFHYTDFSLDLDRNSCYIIELERIKTNKFVTFSKIRASRYVGTGSDKYSWPATEQEYQIAYRMLKQKDLIYKLLGINDTGIKP